MREFGKPADDRKGGLRRLLITGAVLVPIAIAATCIISEVRELPWWYTVRAWLGSTEIQYKLGKIYASGESADDLNKAEKWLRKAAENGSVEAQYELAKNFVKDDEEKITLLRMAAENDYAKAQYELGLMNFRVEHYETAVEWYQKAAAQGLREAQHSLAGCLLRGDGIAKDRKKAVELYRKAAEQEYGPAIAQLEQLGEPEPNADK